MTTTDQKKDLTDLVENLNLKQKIDRSTALIREAHEEYGDSLVIANSLGKDSMVVWDLAKRVSSSIGGFIVTTRYKPEETVRFMEELVSCYPELRIFNNDEEIPENLFTTDPDRCCYLLKVLPTRRAIREMEAKCWVTGLRCTEGRTRTDFLEIEERDIGLAKRIQVSRLFTMHPDYKRCQRTGRTMGGNQ